MHKQTEPLEVATTTDGMIDVLQQIGPHDEDEQVIRLHPDQVDTLIEWLKEAKAELTGEKKLTGV